MEAKIWICLTAELCKEVFQLDSLRATNVSSVHRWRWLGELKQSDGGFRVCVGGEEDVRYGLIKI